MKKIISTLLIVATVFSANAQIGNFGIGTTIPGSKLTVNGSFAATYKQYSTSATIGVADYYVAYTGTSAGTITLPAATVASPASGNILGRIYLIKNTGTAVLTVAATGAERIDNQSGAALASITVSPGFFVTIISKGTTATSVPGDPTTWEVAFTGSSNESAKPQMAVVTSTGNGPTNPNNNVPRGGAASTTPVKSDVVLVNTIVGATYTQQTGTTAGYFTVPAGTYLVTMAIDGDFPSDNTTTGGAAYPIHSFFYDFPSSLPTGGWRLHGNTTGNYGGPSNFGVLLQSTTTVSANTQFKFQIGWGQGGNVSTSGTGLYDFGRATQLSIMKVL